MRWTPPGPKGGRKLPAIEITGSERSQYYLDWLDRNSGIPRTVPPLFRDFCIRYTRSYFNPKRDKEPRTISYEEIVHYEEDLTSLWVSHSLDGRKILLIHSDYCDYDGIRVKATVTAPRTTPYTQEWLEREGIAALYTVLAVQAYILYHRPEVVPVVLTGPPSGKGRKAGPET